MKTKIINQIFAWRRSGLVAALLAIQISAHADTTLFWTGDVASGLANSWDINSSVNWLSNGVPSVYFDGNAVNFTDAGTNQIGTLNQPTLDVVVQPTAVNFNSASNYNLTSPTGAGSIAGAASLNVLGSGMVTLSTSNTFTGDMLVNNGILQIGNVNALGDGTAAATITVTNSGSLDLNGNRMAATNDSVVVSGNGNGNGAVNSSSGYMNLGYNNIGLNNLILAGDTTINASGSDWQIGNETGGITGNNYSLTKNGNGWVYLHKSAVSPVSSLTINGGGFIFIDHPDAVGATTPITLTNSGGINTYNPANWHGLTFANPITVTDPVNGGQIQNTGPSYWGQANEDTFNGNITLNGPLTFTSTSYFDYYGGGPKSYGIDTIIGSISGPGGVNVVGGINNFLANNIQGGNEVVFNGSTTYTGPTTVSKLIQLLLSTAVQSGGSYDIYDYGTLDVALDGTHPTMPMSSLTLESQLAGAGNLSFARIASLSATTPVIYATNLVISSGTIIPPVHGYQIGQFPLVQYSGTIGGAGFAALSLAPLPSGITAALVDNAANHSIDLLVTGLGENLNWTGANSSEWEFATQNWIDPSNSTASLYTDGALVNFNDPATNYSVDIAATVQPGSVTVNTTNIYFISGAAGIGGFADLIKTGLGTLVLSNANSYSGNTTVNGGVLALDYNPGDTTTGTLGGGSTVNVNSGGTLRLDVEDVLGFYGGAPAQLNINGGLVTSPDVANTTSVQNGGTSFRVTLPTVTFTGGTLSSGINMVGDNYGGSYLVPNLINTLPSASTAVMNAYSVSIQNTTFNVAAGTTPSGVDLSVSSILRDWGGAQNLTKLGNGTLALTSTNIYSGNTMVNAGTLALSGNGFLANSPSLVIAGGATFDVSGLNFPFVLSGGQTLANSTSTAIFRGNGNTGSGKVSLTYSNGIPALVVTNGTLTLSSSTTFQINNTGAALAAGNYLLIAAQANGAVAGTLPTVTVNGGGVVSGDSSTLLLNNQQLYLQVAAVNLNPTNIVATVSGGQLTLQWPADHTGWTLQSNAVSLANTSAWFDVAGSTTTNQIIIPIDQTHANVFYRMKY